MVSLETFFTHFYLSAFFFPKTLAVLFLSAVILFAFVLKKLSRTKKTLEETRASLCVYKDALSSLPDGYYLWIYDSVGFIAQTQCSRRLSVMLNLYDGMTSSFDGLLERFSASSSEQLSLALQQMRSENIPFSIELRGIDISKRFLVCGFRSLSQRNTPLLDIIWIRDISESEKQTLCLSEQSEELKIQNTFLLKAFDAFPFPVWMRSEDMQITFCNPAYARAVHADSQEQAILAGTELVYEKSPREARVLAAAARASGKEHKAQEYAVMNGKRRRIEVSEIPLPSSEEFFRSKTLGFVRDITNEQEMRDTLQKHIDSHNGVLEHLKTAIAVFDIDTRLHFYNTSFLNLWDLEEEWLDGSPTYSHFLDLLREKRRLPENRDFSAYKAKEIQYFSTLVSAQEDIMHLPSGITLRRMLTPHPLGGLLITYEDVTGHLTMERSMTVLNEMQGALINHMREAILVFGSDGRLRLANAVYVSMWQFSPEEFKKAPPTVIEVVEKQKPFFETDKNWLSLKEQLLGVITSHTGEIFQMLRPDGKVLEFTALGLPDGGIFVSFFDVTQEEKNSANLSEKENLLAHIRQTTVQTDRLRASFLEQLEQEIKPLLTSLDNASESLLQEKNKELTKPQKSELKLIRDSSKGLKNLMADITDLALIETNTGILELDSVDIPSLLDSAVYAVKEQSKSKNVFINLKCPPDIQPLIADKKRLKQVLYGLLNNAVTSTFKNSSLNLEAADISDEGKAWLEIKVTTVALDLKNIHEPAVFTPLAGATLTLIKSLIMMHGGQLNISDKNGSKETQILLPRH